MLFGASHRPGYFQTTMNGFFLIHKIGPDTFIIGLVGTFWQIICAVPLLTGAIDFEISGRVQYCVVTIVYRRHAAGWSAFCNSNQGLLQEAVDGNLFIKWNNEGMR